MLMLLKNIIHIEILRIIIFSVVVGGSWVAVGCIGWHWVTVGSKTIIILLLLLPNNCISIIYSLTHCILLIRL